MKNRISCDGARVGHQSQMIGDMAYSVPRILNCSRMFSADRKNRLMLKTAVD